METRNFKTSFNLQQLREDSGLMKLFMFHNLWFSIYKHWMSVRRGDPVMIQSRIQAGLETFRTVTQIIIESFPQSIFAVYLTFQTESLKLDRTVVYQSLAISVANM